MPKKSLAKKPNTSGELFLIKILLMLTSLGYLLLMPVEVALKLLLRVVGNLFKIVVYVIKKLTSIAISLTKKIKNTFNTAKNIIETLIVKLKKLLLTEIKFKINLSLPALSVVKLPKIKLPKLKIDIKKLAEFKLRKKAKGKKKKNKKDVKKLKKETVISKNQVNEEKKQKTFSFVFKGFIFGFIFSLVFLFIPYISYRWYKQLPQPSLLDQQVLNKTTKILDKNGNLLYEIYVDKKYNPIPFKEIPENVINATLAIEDAKFYAHKGFRVESILRAAKESLFDDELQGGSTITQQLIKNVLLTPEQTLSRKARELILAILVENQYSKNEILEMYFNNIPYGGTAYGIQAAAQKYFGKDAKDLTLAEAALLAGLPSAPSIYSPVSGNINLSKQRQKQVLDRMVALGYITNADAEVAYAEQLNYVPQIEYIRAPHFVEYVKKELYARYGQRTVDFGGLTVTTSLDLELQEKVQLIVKEEVEKNPLLGFSNGAAVVLDSQSGSILAYVGSIDYFADPDGKFDVVTALRQPGSSIKPLTYAIALDKGYTAASVISDTPVTYQLPGSQKYTPKNYDGKYHGLVTIRTALANSYNIPAVKTISSIGVDTVLKKGQELGFDNWVLDGSYGLSLTLGGKEVRLLDLTNLYATFARLGEYKKPSPFISIKDAYGFEIYKYDNKFNAQVFKQESAYIITNILSDNVARSAAFGSRSMLHIPNYDVAVKTGTTNDIRDNLTLGYTPSYTVGVWVGNNDNTPMNPRLSSGITGAAPIWNKIITTILTNKENESFTIPEGIVKITDLECGNRTEVFDKANKIPERICIIKKIEDDKDKDD